ncbi:hypothetical protein LG291_25510 (plasmid) [Cytobacillus firmus]|uniref:hypothetical protein n=1 Tax=Cytobacillus firmus TaxID=1399 RepID=UPI00384F222F
MDLDFQKKEQILSEFKSNINNIVKNSNVKEVEVFEDYYQDKQIFGYVVERADGLKAEVYTEYTGIEENQVLKNVHWFINDGENKSGPFNGLTAAIQQFLG